MIVGVDIGGTFTDVVCASPASGQAFFAKTLTNYDDIVSSVIVGTRKLLADQGAKEAQIARIVHGTTIATNVVVQKSGVRLAMLTTEGFEDVLEIGRLKRRRMYDLNIDAQTPVFLAPRRHRFGVAERVGSQGEVLKSLDEDSVVRAVERIKAAGISAIAVVYLFSFKNPAHELRTREIIHSIDPSIAVSLSCEVDPIYREYERSVVTAFDTYMRPRVEKFMATLESELRSAKFDAEVYIMQSSGGAITTRIAGQRPVQLFLSGPAGGLLGATKVARQSGHLDLITMDIGGTSCDVALINDGKPSVSSSGEIAEYPVRVPMVDINTIGAGGGSIIWTDRSGMLRVGPRSAGSSPGPACYGRGGKEPTITDASLLLGYLSPDAFAGGAFNLDADLAQKAIETLVGPSGMTPIQIALGAHRIMNIQIAEQIRSMTIKRGHDPRTFALLPFGGAGPVHAGAVSSILGMDRCLVPSAPGVLSAYGLLNAEFEIDQVVSYLTPLADVDHADLERRLQQLRESCIAIAAKEKMPVESLVVSFKADVRYVGQSYELTVPISSAKIDDTVLEMLKSDYEALFRRIYGYSHRSKVEIVNLRAIATRSFEALEGLTFPQLRSDRPPAEHRTRPVWFLGSDTQLDTSIYRRAELPVGTRIAGPAIVQQPDATVIVYPGQAAQVDPSGNLIITGTSEAYGR